ncbi:hypothetical protein CC2G_010164 [Coprinopsis cinerea AmutBmut pab1-1]|nr:hypothetical protein CC2G_010164 [Coprinopsis cinerea AmutBmut pab1-1]
MNGVRRFLGAATSSSQSPPQEPQTPPQQSAAPLFSPKVATATASPTSNPNWSPSHSGGLSFSSSPKSTAALFLKKDRPKPPIPNGDNVSLHNRSGSFTRSSGYARSPSPMGGTGPNSPSSMTSSPRRVPVPSEHTLSRASTSASSSQWNPKRASGPLNTRDELLMSLMASEAVVDSREYQILGTEEVEELKKEHAVLSSRVVAMTKKLALETKIRDAAVSLSKVNSAHKKVSKQTEEQLEAANRRVDTAQRELWRVSERANDVQKRLLEHRAAVLSFSVRNMEKKMSPSIGSEDSGYDSSNRSTLMSPATAISSVSSSSKQSRFDGAHLFAGHADAIVPKRKLSPEEASKEISALEDKLKRATEQLAQASKVQGEMKKELSHLQLEKEEVETMMRLELQTAEDTISALEAELPRLEGLDQEIKTLKQEKISWEEERRQLEEQAREAQMLRERVQELESRAVEASGGSEKVLTDLREAHQRELAEKDAYIKELKDEWNEEREGWNQERSAMEDEKMDDLSRLHEEMDRLREADEQVLQQANNELNTTLNSLRSVVEQFNIRIPARNSATSAMQSLIIAITMHLEEMDRATVSRQQFEAEMRAAREKEESMVKELEQVKKEKESFKRDTMASSRTMSMSSDVFRPPPLPVGPVVTPETTEYGPDVEGTKFIEALQPLWAVLPSPEARASKFGSTSRYRVGSPSIPSASLPGASGANPNGNTAITSGPPASLSDLDVRSLKALYDPRNRAKNEPNNGAFTLEGFIVRVQALIADDRALIERLIRFAQAHDLLKKNAERAQKLAQDGNAALETYQKQVKQLEARNQNLLEKLGVMQAEIQYLNENAERITAEKHQVEAHAADQAEEIAQLNEANNKLSARALTLAEEAANAPEPIRKQLDECRRQLEESKRQLEDMKRQLSEKTKECENAQEEVEAMRTAEQGQRIALLDELNSVQTENGQLRAQLRAAKAGR